MGAPKAPGDEAKHHIMRLGAHILHPPPFEAEFTPPFGFWRRAYLWPTSVGEIQTKMGNIWWSKRIAH